jgi:hypothetical protein
MRSSARHASGRLHRVTGHGSISRHRNGYTGKQSVEKRTETSNFVIPAKAGIQDIDETNNFNSWTPAFAGVTTHPFLNSG